MTSLESFLKGESDVQLNWEGTSANWEPGWMRRTWRGGIAAGVSGHCCTPLAHSCFGHRLLKLKAQNRCEDALSRMDELKGLLEKMFEQLKVLQTKV